MGSLRDLIYNELKKTIREPLRICNVLNRREFNKYLRTQRLKLRYLNAFNNDFPRELVENGYDRISEQYARWTSECQEGIRGQVVEALVKTLPEGAGILDLGCGTGVSSSKILAEVFNVTGVDVSRKSVLSARQNIVNARFIHADMVNLTFPVESYDVVTAFYSLFHIPRSEQPDLLKKIALWLRAGGLFVATMGANSFEAFFEDDWMGVPMYWSSFDSETNQGIIEQAGLKIIKAKKIREKVHGKQNTFLWVIAKKEGGADGEKNEAVFSLVHVLEKAGGSNP
ncbi:methyltransferase domain-containing protein [bacterium]|nr:methyltransferase domain-containing protein [bacterium]